MTQQALALLDAGVFLPVVQILQLVNVVLTLRLSLFHVNVRQHALDDGDLNKEEIKILTSALLYHELKIKLILHHVRLNKSVCFTYRFLQTASIWVLCWSVLQDLFEQKRVLDKAGARDVEEAPQVQLPAEGRFKAAL